MIKLSMLNLNPRDGDKGHRNVIEPLEVPTGDESRINTFITKPRFPTLSVSHLAEQFIPLGVIRQTAKLLAMDQLPDPVDLATGGAVGCWSVHASSLGKCLTCVCLLVFHPIASR